MAPRSLLPMAARPLVLAHRGASRQAPENTVAAFARARRSAPTAWSSTCAGAPTVSWSSTTTRSPSLSGRLVEQPFAEIRAAQPAIPTLAEALEACAGMLVNVEVKCLPWEADADPEHIVVRAAVDLIRERDAHVVVSSFDLGTIDAVRALCTRARAPGSSCTSSTCRVAAALAREHGHAWLHPDVTSTLADLDSVALAHELGLQVDVWTVDDPAQIRTLAAAGVDAIITNAPDVALAALAVMRQGRTTVNASSS